jgi:hypothetical protein
MAALQAWFCTIFLSAYRFVQDKRSSETYG